MLIKSSKGLWKNWALSANAKEMKIETDLSPLYPIQIDTVLMNRVISNLIENAIKYASPWKNDRN